MLGYLAESGDWPHAIATTGDLFRVEFPTFTVPASSNEKYGTTSLHAVKYWMGTFLKKKKSKGQMLHSFNIYLSVYCLFLIKSLIFLRDENLVLNVISRNFLISDIYIKYFINYKS